MNKRYCRYVLATLAFVAVCSMGQGAQAQHPSANDMVWCRAPAAPKLIVNPTTDPIKYDLTKSQADLNNFDIDTRNPYGNSVHTDVGGLMSGGIQTGFTTKFGGLVERTTNQACLWYDTITVTIKITPTIYIASNYPKGSCMYNAVLGHEHKHIDVDRRLVNMYAKALADTLHKVLVQQTVFGPIPAALSEQKQAEMQNRVQAAVNTRVAQLNQERLRQQQQIDSVDEYNRVNTSCLRR